MGRRSRQQVLMDCAFAFSARSSCNRGDFGAVGAVIAQQGRILSTGYNGVPSGMKHCDHTCTCLFLKDEDHHPNCPAVKPCIATIHAEANAIAFAARYGTSILGATMYVTLSPCFECAKLIVNTGLMEVVFESQYRDPSGIQLLSEAKIKVWKLT